MEKISIEIGKTDDEEFYKRPIHVRFLKDKKYRELYGCEYCQNLAFGCFRNRTENTIICNFCFDYFHKKEEHNFYQDYNTIKLLDLVEIKCPYCLFKGKDLVMEINSFKKHLEDCYFEQGSLRKICNNCKISGWRKLMKDHVCHFNRENFKMIKNIISKNESEIGKNNNRTPELKENINNVENITKVTYSNNEENKINNNNKNSDIICVANFSLLHNIDASLNFSKESNFASNFNKMNESEKNIIIRNQNKQISFNSYSEMDLINEVSSNQLNENSKSNEENFRKKQNNDYIQTRIKEENKEFFQSKEIESIQQNLEENIKKSDKKETNKKNSIKSDKTTKNLITNNPRCSIEIFKKEKFQNYSNLNKSTFENLKTLIHDKGNHQSAIKILKYIKFRISEEIFDICITAAKDEIYFWDNIGIEKKSIGKISIKTDSKEKSIGYLNCLKIIKTFQKNECEIIDEKVYLFDILTGGNDGFLRLFSIYYNFQSNEIHGIFREKYCDDTNNKGYIQKIKKLVIKNRDEKTNQLNKDFVYLILTNLKSFYMIEFKNINIDLIISSKKINNNIIEKVNSEITNTFFNDCIQIKFPEKFSESEKNVVIFAGGNGKMYVFRVNKKFNEKDEKYEFVDGFTLDTKNSSNIYTLEVLSYNFSKTEQSVLFTSAGADSNIYIWKYFSYNEINQIVEFNECHTKSITALKAINKYNQNQNYFITTSIDGKIKFWNISEKDCFKVLDKENKAIRAIKISSNENAEMKIYYVGDDNKLKIWS